VIKMFQKEIFDMKTVRALQNEGIIFSDEKLREAGKQGAKAGEKLREIL
jgi:hypothetical protein